MSKGLYIGEVVYNNDMKMVIIDFVSREETWSTSYDRKYKLCSLEEIENIMSENRDLSEQEFNNLGHWVEIKGLKFPDIKRVEDISPFEITSTVKYQFRQKQAKIVIVYE